MHSSLLLVQKPPSTVLIIKAKIANLVITLKGRLRMPTETELLMALVVPVGNYGQLQEELLTVDPNK